MTVSRFSDLRKEFAPPYFKNSAICYGHFDVIHPGHMRYFKNAGQFGKPLIVAIEGDLRLQQAGDKVSFSESDRAYGVGALDLVDHVVILDGFSLEDFISWVSPQVLVLGKEFERERLYEVKSAVERIEELGGKIVYEVGTTNYTTSNLEASSYEEIESKREAQFRQIIQSRAIDLKAIAARIQDDSGKRILVIGDTIIDQFVDCDPLGMSSEAPLVVVREKEKRDFLGGAGIVAAHISTLGSQAIYLSVVGEDVQSEVCEEMLNEHSVENYLIKDSSRPTTSKRRYLVERQKIFRVSHLTESAISRSIEEKMNSVLEGLGPSLNGIVVSDFSYGVVTPGILKKIRSVAAKFNIPLFGDLQCSSQIGNVSKFENFFAITPTEKEARIALSNQNDSLEYVANALLEKTRAENLYLKLGSEGVIAYCRSDGTEFFDRQHFPALCVNPLDVAGAGDAMLATIVVATVNGASPLEAAAIASIASSISVRTMGNQPIRLKEVMNYSFSRKFFDS